MGALTFIAASPCKFLVVVFVVVRGREEKKKKKRRSEFFDFPKILSLSLSPPPLQNSKLHSTHGLVALAALLLLEDLLAGLDHLELVHGGLEVGLGRSGVLGRGGLGVGGGLGGHLLGLLARDHGLAGLVGLATLLAGLGSLGVDLSLVVVGLGI